MTALGGREVKSEVLCLRGYLTVAETEPDDAASEQLTDFLKAVLRGHGVRRQSAHVRTVSVRVTSNRGSLAAFGTPEAARAAIASASRHRRQCVQQSECSHA